MASTILARSSIAISSLEPRLMGVAISRSQCIIWSTPSTQSSMKLDAANGFHHSCQIVDRDQFARTEVDGRGNQPVAVHNLVDTEHAIVDEAEAAGLRSVAPNVDGGVAEVEGFDYLTAERGRRFLTASEPGAVGAVDVVEAGNVGFQTAFRPILLAKHLREEFLPTVTSLSHGWVRVRFLKSAHVWIPLQVGVVGAGRRGKEIALGAGTPGAFNQVGVD